MNPPTDHPARTLATIGLTLWLALSYAVTGVAGLLLGAPSPVFPSAGLALGALLWFGWRAIPGVWLGALALNLGLNWMGDHWLGDSFNPTMLLVAAVISSGASLQAVVGERLVRRWLQSDWREMAQETDVVRFLLFGGVLAGILSPSFGASALLFAGRIGRGDFFFTWWTWYVGDVIGILVFAPLTVLLLNRRDPLWRQRQRHILAPMLMTLVLAILAFHGASRWEKREQFEQARKAGEDIARDIANRLETHREILSSLRHFIEANPDFTPRQFEQFTGSTLRDNPDIFALSFNDWVTEQERPAYEARMKRVTPGGRFQITELDDHRQQIRAAARPYYAPVRLIEPLEANQSALGFDIASEPSRRAAIEEAIATQRMGVTPPLKVVQESGRQASVLEILAVNTAAANAQQPLRLKGFVVAAVRIEDMIVQATQGQVAAGLVMELSHPRGPEGGVLQFRITSPDSDLPPAESHPSWQTRLPMGARDWTLSVTATQGYLDRHRSWVAWVVGVFGLLFAALLQIHMLGMTGGAAIIQRKNRELEAAERELRELNAGLEHKVTERTRELADARRELEQTAYELTENIPVGTYTMVLRPGERMAHFSFMSRRFLELTGLDRAEAAADPLKGFACVHPEDYAAWVRLNAEAFTRKGPFFGQTRMIVGGKIRWITAESIPRGLADGSMVWEGVLIDVTDRVLVQQRLEESERNLRLILDHLPTPVVVSQLTPEAPFSFMNQMFTATFGYTIENVPTVHEWVHQSCPDPAYRREIAGRWERTFSRGMDTRVPTDPMECKLVSKDGITRDVLVTALALDEIVVTVILDITERKSREERLRRILDNVPVPIAIYEPGSHRSVSFLNAAFIRTFGYTLVDIPTLDEWIERAYPDLEYRRAVLGQWEGAVSHSLRERIPVEPMEFSVITKSGDCRNVIISAVPQDDMLVTALLDITQRKRAEAALIEAKQRAERLERAKSEFLANMSHEIRTPMNAVLGLAQLLERESLAAHQREMIQHIRDAGQSLMGIINDVLDYSKIEAGQLTFDPHPFSLTELLKRLANLFEQSALGKGLRLRVNAPAETLGGLIGDMLRLEQVLINLIGNAIKFTERGEVALDIAVIESDEVSVRLYFAVRDTGIGINQEIIDQLFTPFTQAEAGTTRCFGGTGLGLSISKRLVELMGGEIGVESQPGVGSTFWLELPFLRAKDVVPETASPTPAPAGVKRLSGVCCLVVDDSGMNRDLVARALSLEGATAQQAVDGREAVELLRQRPREFDIVLMDVRMPIMDGLTATRMIRGELGLTELPVIALTAGVLPTEVEAARDAGVNDVLAKPLNLEQLTVCLLNWIQPARAPAAAVGRGSGSGEGRAGVTAPPIAEDRFVDGEGEFPAIAGIDRERAKLTLMGNRGLFLNLLMGFIEEFADIAAAVRADLARADQESAARRLHTLRGNAGTLGAMAIMEAARVLENAIKQGDSLQDAGLSELAALMADLDRASAPWLEGAVDPREDSAASDEPPFLDSQALTALRKALRSHDLGALNHFATLRPTLRGVLDEPILLALNRAIQSLNFEEALGLLANHCPESDPGNQ